MPALGLVVAVLWAVSGACLVMTCRDKLRADRFCVWVLLHTVFALLAAILLGRSVGGPWALAARTALYFTCVGAILGAIIHANALMVQSRLRRSRSLVQTRQQLEEIEARLGEMVQEASERFLSAYQPEADDIERLQAPGLAGLLKKPVVDGDRSQRLRVQSRYLNYSEQVLFSKVARLLGQKEELLVHIAPILKHRYLMDVWCDVQVCLFAVTVAFAAVYEATELYY